MALLKCEARRGKELLTQARLEFEEIEMNAASEEAFRSRQGAKVQHNPMKFLKVLIPGSVTDSSFSRRVKRRTKPGISD